MFKIVGKFIALLVTLFTAAWVLLGPFPALLNAASTLSVLGALLLFAVTTIVACWVVQRLVTSILDQLEEASK